MEIITGRTGQPHVYAADDAEIYRLFLGDGDFLLTTGNKLQATMNGTTEVRVADGSLMMQGRLAKIRPTDGYDTVTLDIGTVGYKRVDLVVAEYKQTTVTTQEEIEGELVDVVDKFDSVELKVVKGTPNVSEYVEPDITTGDIDNGETHQVKLWAVQLDGINFNALIDHRIILDTTPIQTALSYANSAVAQIRESLADFEEEIVQGLRGAWKTVVTVADATSAIPVTISGYTYSATDVFEVYLEGLRLAPSEYTIAYSNGLTVELDATTFTGQMEVVVFRVSEGA